MWYAFMIGAVLCTGTLLGMPTPDFQAKGTANVSICSSGDVGLTVGGFNYESFKSDVGIDFDLSDRNMAYLSAKVGFDEDVLFKHFPSVNIGISNAGIQTKSQPLDHPNILHAVFGMSLPKQINGRAYAGVFHGNRIMGKERTGYFFGYVQNFLPKLKNKILEYHQLVLDSVYVNGKSSLAGTTILAKYYLNPKISIQAGPKWSFNVTTKESSKWSFEKVKWLVILSVDL